MEQTAFVFIKPHAVLPSVEQLLAERLSASGFRVAASGTVSADEIAAGRLAERHYGALAQRAMTVTPAELPQPPPKAQVSSDGYTILSLSVLFSLSLSVSLSCPFHPSSFSLASSSLFIYLYLYLDG